MNYQRESSVHKDSYREDQVLGRAEWFLDVLNRVNGNRNGRNLLWKAAASAPVGFCHITSGVPGKLLEGIMDGLNLDRIQRRFARLEEIETRWKAPAPADHEGGVFAGVPTRTAKPKSDDLTPRVNMTWVKFRDTVLPRATKIEFQVRQRTISVPSLPRRIPMRLPSSSGTARSGAILSASMFTEGDLRPISGG